MRGGKLTGEEEKAFARRWTRMDADGKGKAES
jgi:hypothetical protein